MKTIFSSLELHIKFINIIQMEAFQGHAYMLPPLTWLPQSPW
jgi:hypothetical protein